MTHHAERVVVHDREIHLDVFEPLAVGDTFEVIRGNGPREGDRMGTATVTGFEDGEPVLDLLFDGSPPEIGLRFDGSPPGRGTT